MIIFDTETTGLLEIDSEIGNELELSKQPYMIEFGAIKVADDDLDKEIDRLGFLIKPPISIPEDASRVNNIYDKDVADKPSFASKADEIIDFFLGEKYLLGHHIMFDLKILVIELKRMGIEFKFPYPHEVRCTVEMGMNRFGKRISLIKLYENLYGNKPNVSHRAIDDAITTLAVYKALRQG